MVRLPLALRGEVWMTELDPTVGREIQKARPCLIVSPDAMNRYLDTVTVMPLTSGSRAAPWRVPSRFAGKGGFLLADQLRTADRQRLRSRMGIIDGETLSAALTVLQEMFAE